MELGHVLKHQQHALLVQKNDLLLLYEDDFIRRSFEVFVFRNNLVVGLSKLRKSA